LRNQSYFADGRRDSRISTHDMREKRISFAASVHNSSHSPKKPSQHYTSSHTRGPSHLRNASNIDELRGDVSAALEVITGRKSIPSYHEARPGQLLVPPLPSPGFSPGTPPSPATHLSSDPLFPPPSPTWSGMEKSDRSRGMGPDEMMKAYALNNVNGSGGLGNGGKRNGNGSPEKGGKGGKSKKGWGFRGQQDHEYEEDPYGGVERDNEGYINFRK